jgi:hypothetical protein
MMSQSDAFSFQPLLQVCCKTRSFGLSALGKAHNRQAELARKLKLAKQQQHLLTTGNLTTIENATGNNFQSENDSNQQQRLEMKKTEFDRLLAQNVSPLNENEALHASQRGAATKTTTLLPKLSKPQIKRTKKIVKTIENSTQVDLPLQEGDTAIRLHFESLVCTSTRKPLGPMGAAQLVPWVPPYLNRNLIVVVDPRKHSSEWRSIVQLLTSNYSNLMGDLQSSIIAVTVDDPDETTA